MAAIPQVPADFALGDTSISEIQQLTYAVNFLGNYDVRPLWHLEPSTTPSIGANAWTTLPYSIALFDSDKVSDSTGALIVTQGYYAVEAALQIAAVSSDGFNGSFLITGGANNPHLGAGSTIRFGLRGGETNSTADAAICLSDVVPVVCYPGDQIVVQYYVSTARTSDANTNATFNTGRFNRPFMGHFIRTGT